jgi:hypothetical protein
MDRTFYLLISVNYISILLLIHNLAHKTLVRRLIIVSFWNFGAQGGSGLRNHRCFVYTTV